jgi:hypothetical protein
MTKELTKRELFRLEDVKLVVTSNPKKAGTMSYDRFENYFACELKYPDGYTVGDALKEGVRMDDIQHDKAHGFILVGEDAIKAWEDDQVAVKEAQIEAARKLLAEVDAE